MAVPYKGYPQTEPITLCVTVPCHTGVCHKCRPSRSHSVLPSHVVQVCVINVIDYFYCSIIDIKQNAPLYIYSSVSFGKHAQRYNPSRVKMGTPHAPLL